MMPGMKPRMVRAMLMSRSAPQPRSRKTPRGGRMMAKMILQMSLVLVSLVVLLHFVTLQLLRNSRHA